MPNTKGQQLRRVEAEATCRTGRLAAELVQAQSKDRELILAEMEYQRWLAGTCSDCLDGG